MEHLDLIRLNTPTRTATITGEKLSSQFAGALKLTDAQYKEYQNTLQESRSEWVAKNIKDYAASVADLRNIAYDKANGISI